jgi:hypothetical protein
MFLHDLTIPSTDKMTKWQDDKMTKWQSDKVTKWQSDKVTKWQSDKVTKWQSDKVTKRQNDKMTKWQNDKMTNWQNDKMTKWQNGKMTKWQNDKMTKWQNDTRHMTYIKNPAKTSCTMFKKAFWSINLRFALNKLVCFDTSQTFSIESNTSECEQQEPTIVDDLICLLKD